MLEKYKNIAVHSADVTHQSRLWFFDNDLTTAQSDKGLNIDKLVVK